MSGMCRKKQIGSLMKKFSHTVFSVLLLISLTCFSFLTAGCENNSKDPDKISVVASIFPQYDFVRAVAGDRVDLSMLLSPGEETHSYEPTPKEIRSIENCDIFIYVGGESDSWIDNILESIDTSDMTVISLMDIVELLEEEENDEHHEREYDEHVWTSPVNAAKIVDEITNALCSADPQNSDIYRQNCTAYVEELTKLDEQFRETISEAARKTIIFADRFPLLYFAKEYGLEYYAAFPGCAGNTEPSPSTIARLIDKINQENIPVVFKIELSSSNIALTVNEATGAKVITFYSCHNISKSDFNNGETYLALMNKNLLSLKEALN